MEEKFVHTGQDHLIIYHLPITHLDEPFVDFRGIHTVIYVIIVSI